MKLAVKACLSAGGDELTGFKMCLGQASSPGPRSLPRTSLSLLPVIQDGTVTPSGPVPSAASQGPRGLPGLLVWLPSWPVPCHHCRQGNQGSEK